MDDLFFDHPVIASILIAIVICAICIGGVYLLAPPMCDALTDGIGYENSWTFMGGCKINVDGNLIPIDNYRYFGD